MEDFKNYSLELNSIQLGELYGVLTEELNRIKDRKLRQSLNNLTELESKFIHFDDQRTLEEICYAIKKLRNVEKINIRPLNS